MIFALVGTHEQPFNRLIQLLDELKTDETILVQTGYSTYVPKNIQSVAFIEFDAVLDYMKKADVIVTHAGTGTVMMALNQGKCPLVLARNPKYNEHIDDHQTQIVDFLSDKGQIVPYFEGDSFVDKIEEARVRSLSTGAGIVSPPDPRLVAEIALLIDT